MRQEKVSAEAAKRKAELLAARCLARDDNVVQLQKELFTASSNVTKKNYNVDMRIRFCNLCESIKF